MFPSFFHLFFLVVTLCSHLTSAPRASSWIEGYHHSWTGTAGRLTCWTTQTSLQQQVDRRGQVLLSCIRQIGRLSRRAQHMYVCITRNFLLPSRQCDNQCSRFKSLASLESKGLAILLPLLNRSNYLCQPWTVLATAISVWLNVRFSCCNTVQQKDWK